MHPVSGEVIVAGITDSTNLPGPAGRVQATNGGGFDAFVGRFNASLTSLLQVSYLGGSDYETANAVTVHPVTGDVIIAGQTQSTNLPGTAGGAQASFGGGNDAFVSRFNASLTALLQSSYIGGSGREYAQAVTVHPASGEVIVAGYTDSTDLPGATGGAQPSNGGGGDAFISRFNASLTTRLQSSYLGGSGDDQANAVTVHPVSGEVIIAGETFSTNLPGTAGGAQTTNGGSSVGFVSRFNASLTALLQSSYFGGNVWDGATAVTVHPVSGEVIIGGWTASPNLPGTAGGPQPIIGGSFDAFVSRFNPSLTAVLQSTYLGTSGNERAQGITVHPVSGEVIVAGFSTATNLPGAAKGAQAAYGGGQDAFVARFSADLSSLLQSTYLGGSGSELANAVTVHPVSGEIIVAGSTASTNLPGASGGPQPTFGGGFNDAFVSRLTPDLRALLCNLDINGDSAVTPEKDGVLLLRYALGFRGATLIAGVPLGAARANAAAVETFIGSSAQYQVFGQPSAPAKAMQDGLVLLRLMRGIGDSALLNGIAPPAGATFTTGSTVRANVNARCGTAY